MSNLDEIPSDAGQSARPGHSNGLQIVLLNIDPGLYAVNQRAAHQTLDNPKIFEDLLALRIIRPEAESKLLRSPAQFQNRLERTERVRGCTSQ